MTPIHILLIEDNEGDILLTKEALSDANFGNQITVQRDGDAAIKFLEKFSEVPSDLPGLILLDINLPKIDGIEVLHFIKGHERLKSIPVVMLTTSSSNADVKEAYNNHANCYITKPVDFNNFFEIIKAIENFWLSIVKLPNKD